MSGTFTAELAKVLDVIERDRNLAKDFVIWVHCFYFGEMQKSIEQHGSVPVGEYEAIAVGQDGIVRIKTQQPLPQSVGHGCERHGSSGMPRIGFLHGIHRESAHGVDAELIDIAVHAFLASGRNQGLGNHTITPRPAYNKADL